MGAMHFRVGTAGVARRRSRRRAHAAWLIVPFFVILLPNPGPARALLQDTATDGDVAARMADLCEQVCQTLQSNQFRPVTRQQFALLAVRVIREQAGLGIDRSLAEEAGKLAEPADIRNWLIENIRQAASRTDDWDTGEIVNRIAQQFDPHALVISASQAAVNRQLAENRYVGIGIRIRFVDGFAMIEEAFPGGPARLAGARQGDLIVEVDGHAMKGLELAEVVEHLRGKISTPVSVVVRNTGDDEMRTLEMVREIVPIASVQGVRQDDDGTWEFISESSPEIARLSVSSMTGSTASELADAANRVRLAGVQGVILDLRLAEDADLHHAHLIADALVGKGHFATVVDGSGNRQVLETGDETAFANLPLAVLVPPRPSGPVFAILNGLARREQTVLVGDPVESHLDCYAAFEFPDGGGSVEGVAWARIDRDSLEIPQPDVPDQGDSRQLRDSHLGPAVLLPSIRQTGLERQIAAAEQWLIQHR